MCPKGFAIEHMSSSLLQPGSAFPWLLDSSFVNWSRAQNYNLGSTLKRHEEYCTSLRLCLLYQACVFDFGNEFCKADPNPGQRKVMMLNVTCVKDKDSKFKESEKRDLVAHLTYKSKLAEVGIDPEAIDLKATQISINERLESFVFGATCPNNAYDLGYTGMCNNAPSFSWQGIIEHTWHITSRLSSVQSQAEIMEVFCAIQFQPNVTCVPPNFVAKLYPKRGTRPRYLWNILEKWNNAIDKVSR